MPNRRTGPELLDLVADQAETPELAESLAELRMVNRYLGGTNCVMRHFRELAVPGNDISVLDVATGSADIPVAVVRWARSEGVRLKVTAVDINPLVAGIARERVKAYPEISVLVADALKLPFGPASFDIVLCSTALHHIPEGRARGFLRNIASIARTGYVVGDLRRSWVAYVLIYVITRLGTKNRLTRCDGPLSVLRSFTRAELAALAKEAGLEHSRVVRRPYWRMALVGGPHEA